MTGENLRRRASGASARCHTLDAETLLALSDPRPDDNDYGTT